MGQNCADKDKDKTRPDEIKQNLLETYVPSPRIVNAPFLAV